MKKSSLIILVITAIFLSFIGGMFLGRYHNTGSITVLAEHQSPTTKKINIIGIKRNDEFEITPDPDAPLLADDVLVIIGKNQTLSKLAGGN